MTLTYNTLNATTQERFIPALKDQIFESNILLYRLLKDADNTGAKIGGTKVIEPLEYAKSTKVGSYSKGDALTSAEEEFITAAEFDWKREHADLYIDGLEEVENMGSARVIDLVAAKMKSASKSLADDMATQLFSDGTGNSSKDLVGLAAAVDDASNIDTYGGIQRSTDGDSWWKAYYETDASDFTLSRLRTAYAACRVSGDVPTLIVSDTTEMNNYESIFLDTSNTLWVQALQPKVLDGSFQAYSFKGTPWVEDKLKLFSLNLLNLGKLLWDNPKRKALAFVQRSWKHLKISRTLKIQY
jgi:hypothetical protein